MLLAAGEGRRLRPLTDNNPKCMVPLAGKPLLQYNVEWLARYKVKELLINLFFLPDVILEHFGDGKKWAVKIHYSAEHRLLGTAGGVKKVSCFFDGPFFVWYGDNLSRCDLRRLYQFHLAHGALVTIALHHREDPTQSGIVELAANSRIVRFLEKPAHEQVFSHWVNAGIYVLEPEVLHHIPPDGSPDFGRDVFPALLKKGKVLAGYCLSEEEGLWWVDRPEDLARVSGQIGQIFNDRRLFRGRSTR